MGKYFFSAKVPSVFNLHTGLDGGGGGGYFSLGWKISDLIGQKRINSRRFNKRDGGVGLID